MSTSPRHRLPVRVRLAAALAAVALAAAHPAACADTTRIRDVQGAAHRSPLEGRWVRDVPGIVTAVHARGFHMEDWLPDADPATSEGVAVATRERPGVAVGDRVRVSGRVVEHVSERDAAAGATTVTRIDAVDVLRDAAGAAALLPPAVTLGRGGRLPPPRLLDPARTGDTARRERLQPGRDAIDFLESLEGMRVAMREALVVGPTRRGETAVVPADSPAAARRSRRGALRSAPGEPHAERLLIAARRMARQPRLPPLDVGDRLAGVAGVLEPRLGRWRVLLAEPPRVTRGAAEPPRTRLVSQPGRLRLATFNLQNLDPGDGTPRFERLAAQIVQGLGAPDIVALQEVQDDDGPLDSGRVGAVQTLRRLVEAVRAAGGPGYAWRQVDPADGADGGEPGGNIRLALLFDPRRVAAVDRPGVAAVDRPGGEAWRPVAVMRDAAGARLAPSPGRVAPTDPAFASSRKPLAVELAVDGRRLFVVVNHFVSRLGDAPPFARLQPPAAPSATQRLAQAKAVARFAGALLATDPQAPVVVLGDFNDDEDSPPLRALAAVPLVNLVERLPFAERYTTIHDGDAQPLDHVLVSPALARHAAPEVDIVHLDAEVHDAASDHDPVVVRLAWPPPVSPPRAAR